LTDSVGLWFSPFQLLPPQDVPHFAAPPAVLWITGTWAQTDLPLLRLLFRIHKKQYIKAVSDQLTHKQHQISGSKKQHRIRRSDAVCCYLSEFVR
jgi:hypothetical protein